MIIVLEAGSLLYEPLDVPGRVRYVLVNYDSKMSKFLHACQQDLRKLRISPLETHFLLEATFAPTFVESLDDEEWFDEHIDKELDENHFAVVPASIDRLSAAALPMDLVCVVLGNDGTILFSGTPQGATDVYTHFVPIATLDRLLFEQK